MLNQLIFLGQIPGTDLQLTFYEIQTIVLSALMVFLVRKEFSLLAERRQTAYKAPTPAVSATRRKASALRVNNALEQLELFAFPIPPSA
jgi:hypothetical protein